MDRDFDGRLSFEEFMGEETTLEKLFKNMDKDGDGVVTKQVRIMVLQLTQRSQKRAQENHKEKVKTTLIRDLKIKFKKQSSKALLRGL